MRVTLEQITLNQPFDTLIGVLVFFILICLSMVLSKKIYFHKDLLINFFIIYYLILILKTHLLLFVALAGFELLLLRVILGIIFFIIIAYTIMNKKSFFFKEIIKYFPQKKYFKFFIIIYFILSLSPVTDADSLDYHLGVAVEIINQGKYIPRYDWLHYMLAGPGEILNLFSIIIGSKNFVHILSFSSLCIIVLLFNFLKDQYNSKFNSDLYLLSTPIFLWFLTSNKTQLICSVLIFLCLYLLFELKKIYNKRILLFIILSFCFVILNKASFFINSFILITLYFLFTKFQKIKDLILFSLIVFIIFALPNLVKNFIFYQDIYPPLFENFKENPNWKNLTFRYSLATDNAGFLVLNGYLYFLAPILLFFPTNISTVTALLGGGIVYLIFVYKIDFKKNFENKFLLTFIMISFFSFILIGNFQPRYFLELYLATCFLILKNYEYIKNNLTKLINLGLYVSTFFIFLAALLSIFTLSSGSISKSYYQNTMMKYAYNYEEIDWIYSNIEPNSKITGENIRSHALMRGPFVARSRIFDTNTYEEFIAILKKEKINYVVFNTPVTKKNFKIFLEKCADKEVYLKKRFSTKTRNFLSKYRKNNFGLLLIKNSCK